MPEQYFTIEAGKIKEQTRFTKWLWEHKNGRWSFKTESKSKRSVPQNKYYWACIVKTVYDILREAGYNEITTLEDAHEILKYKFLRKQIVTDQGEVIEFVGSTANLSKEDFGNYLEECVIYIHQTFGVTIEPPGTQTVIEY